VAGFLLFLLEYKLGLESQGNDQPNTTVKAAKVFLSAFNLTGIVV